MNKQLARALSSALVLISVTWADAAQPALRSAHLVVAKPPAKQSGSLAGHGFKRSVLIAASGRTFAITAPSGGCTGLGSGTGVSNFVGAEGRYPPYFGTPTNFVYDSGDTDFNTVVAGEYNGACDAYGFIGAGADNTIGDDSLGFSGYGGIVAGLGNGINGQYEGFVGGGNNNLLGSSSGSYEYAAGIGAGQFNTIGAGNDFIAAGVNNTIATTSSETNGQSAFIGAGYDNSVGGGFAAIVAGEYNSAGNDNSVIAGGARNTSTGFASFIGAGYRNTVSGYEALVAGGTKNSASGIAAVVPGGTGNVAGGANSFAAGNGSQAVYDGSFVWSDDSVNATTLVSSGGNQFLARAAGGFYLYSSANLSSGVKLASGSGSWSTLSDRAAKTGITGIDDARILGKIAALPVSEWSYTAQGSGIRHLGPMAQDFYAAFGLGEDNRHISAVDEEGVALAAIKGLASEVGDKGRALSDLAQKYSDLGAKYHELGSKYAELDAKYAKLEAQINAVTNASTQ